MSKRQVRKQAAIDFHEYLRNKDVASAAGLLKTIHSTERITKAKALIRFLLTEGRDKEAADYAKTYGINIAFTKRYVKLPVWLRSHQA